MNGTNKKRRYHKRSRTGCSRCKQRRVRCDEIRPSWLYHFALLSLLQWLIAFSCRSTQCIIAQLECPYGLPEAPLRDRRVTTLANPGVVIWQLPNAAVDPFDSLPIRMPLRSLDLARYFREIFRSEYCDGSPGGTEMMSAGGQRIDQIGLSLQEPTTVRILVLISAFHYLWRTGSFHTFDKTFFFHKAEAIRRVNEWLANPDPSELDNCMKLVSALSISESCIGNFPAASTHADGLLTLFDIAAGSRGVETDAEFSETREMRNRLLLSSNSFSCAVKSRVTEDLAFQADAGVVWHRAFSGLPDNLRATELLPSLYLGCTSPSGEALRIRDIVDATPIIAAMRQLTSAMARSRRGNGAVRHHQVVSQGQAPQRSLCDGENPAACPACRGYCALFRANIATHAWSLEPSSCASSTISSEEDILDLGPAPLGLPSSWSGMHAAGSCYLNAVIPLWHGGQPYRPAMLSKVVQILREDLVRSKEKALEAGKGHILNASWFWKVFAGASALQLSMELGDNVECMADLYWFEAQVRRWSQSTVTTAWVDARACLAELVWPDADMENPMHLVLWNRATS